MPKSTYQIEDFRGIDQSRSENKLPANYAPEAWNMDTENGDLAVAKGYEKFISTPVPGTGAIRRMYLWHTVNEDRFIVIAGNSVYRYVPANSSWEIIYTYSETITSTEWDFEEVRIGTEDCLIIANGQTQLIKWTGTGSAVLFGSGEYVHETTIAAVAHNMLKATSAAYSETDTAGALVLTMPSGHAYTAGIEIAFTVPAIVHTETISSLTVNDGINTYTMDFVPAWISGDTAVIKLTSTTTAEYSHTRYGIVRVTLAAAVPETWKQRVLDVGMQLNGVTYEIESINDSRTILTLATPTTITLTAGNTAKLRGGISDIPVNYIEIHYSRLFSAGNPEHPSRLYWSQPPGDIKTIEDWSQDEASDVTSGGHVEVGNTSSEPIVGLCSLSNQLLIFKATSIYRLLGDRPTNYRIVKVNADVERMANTSRVSYSDVPYWLTSAGMYYHDGQVARLAPNARQIRHILNGADLSVCKATENRDRLYFTCRCGTGEYDDTVIVYDLTERTYMLRNGFNVIDICAKNGSMYLINDARYVYKFNAGDTYDGAPVNAYWRSPMTDLGAKSRSKAVKQLLLRGEGDIILLEVTVGESTIEYRYLMPNHITSVLDIPLKNEGKAFSVRISNEHGSYFRLTGGVELIFEVKGD